MRLVLLAKPSGRGWLNNPSAILDDVTLHLCEEARTGS